MSNYDPDKTVFDPPPRYNYYSSGASKPINIRWIRTGSQPLLKIMLSIVSYPVFYEYKNV